MRGSSSGKCYKGKQSVVEGGCVWAGDRVRPLCIGDLSVETRMRCTTS